MSVQPIGLRPEQREPSLNVVGTQVTVLASTRQRTSVSFYEVAMSWVLVQEEHRRGSADPYVARTIMQAGCLAAQFQLGREKEEGISSVFNKYRRHLHQCHDISQRIMQEIKEHSQALKASSENQKTGEVLRLPSVRNLTNDVETFLYHAKLAFRELKNLFFIHTEQGL
jgi:hypothetical protein